MAVQRNVEHYRGHELVCEVALDARGWYYTLSAVSHHGGESEARSECSTERYASLLQALRAGRATGRALIDSLVSSTAG